MAKRQRRKFTDKYKGEAVRLVREEGMAVTQVARDLDLTKSSLRNWVKQAHVDGGKGPAGAPTSSELEELRRLRRENRLLRMEREILKNHLVPALLLPDQKLPKGVALACPGGAAGRLLVHKSPKKTWPGGDCGLVIGDAHRVIPFRKVIVFAHPSSSAERRRRSWGAQDPRSEVVGR